MQDGTKTKNLDFIMKLYSPLFFQGPLSKITGMEQGRVRDSITRFNQFLQNPDNYNCSQLAKVSSTRQAFPLFNSRVNI
jgi:hypothetical protein